MCNFLKVTDDQFVLVEIYPHSPTKAASYCAIYHSGNISEGLRITNHIYFTLHALS